MKQQFLFSFKALIKSKKFFYCIVFAIVGAFLLEFMMLWNVDDLYKVGDPNYGFFFISMNNTIVLNLFLMLLPLLSILPYGDTYYREKDFVNQILTRTSKGKYLIVNSIMAFVTGFLFIFVFLFFMYYFNYLLVRSHIENPFYMITSFSENTTQTLQTFPLFTNLLLEHTTLYILVYSIILSGYAGLLSLSVYSISLLSKNKIVAYITPFALCIITIPITLLLPDIFSHWPPHMVFSPRSETVFCHGLALAFWCFLFLIISISFNVRKYREDVLE